MYCTHCGVELPEQAKFCPGCGVSLDREVVVSEVVTDKPKEAKCWSKFAGVGFGLGLSGFITSTFPIICIYGFRRVVRLFSTRWRAVSSMPRNSTYA